MKLNLINILILVSSFQLLFAALIVFQKYGKTTANRTLALLLLSLAVILFNMFLWDVSYFDVSPRLLLTFIGIPFIVAPLMYLYTRFLTHLSERFRAKDLLHFLPVLLSFFAALPYILKTNEQLFNSLPEHSETVSLSPLFIFNWLVMIQVVAYTILTVRLVKNYSGKIKNLFSNVEKIKLGWLRNITILFSLIALLYTVENLFVTGGVLPGNYNISTISTILFSFIFSYLILMKSDIFMSPGFTEQIIEAETELPSEEEPRKYEKSGLSEDKAAAYLTSLLQLMEKEKPYLDSDLTLHKLAGILQVSPHHLSEVLNRKLNQNFFDFVNKYRVERVKSDLINPGKNNLTLLALALDAGFSSKSSFNLIFKKHTGVTPTEYKKNNITS